MPLAPVGQEVPEEPACEAILLPEARGSGEQFLGQPDLGDVGGGELVGEGHPVRGAQQVQLHAVDREGAPPHPRGSLEARRLPDLARVQHLQQRRIDDQGLRFADEFSGRIALRRGSRKRLSFLTRRLNEEG